MSDLVLVVSVSDLVLVVSVSDLVLVVSVSDLVLVVSVSDLVLVVLYLIVDNSSLVQQVVPDHLLGMVCCVSVREVRLEPG